jgi:hypothetical protein
VSALDALLEGFSDELHPRGWHGRFRKGDRVRVLVKGGDSIVGRVLRPAEGKEGSHVIVQPEGGRPHIEARISQVELDTPERQAREQAKQRDFERAVAGNKALWAKREQIETDLRRQNPLSLGGGKFRQTAFDAFLHGAQPDPYRIAVEQTQLLTGTPRQDKPYRRDATLPPPDPVERVRKVPRSARARLDADLLK